MSHRFTLTTAYSNYHFLLGVPDATARYHILKVLLKYTPHVLTEDQLRTIAGQTHGYVGADLGAAVREAGTRAIKRVLAANPTSSSVENIGAPAVNTALESTEPDNKPSDDIAALTLSDMTLALPSIRPSALRSVFLETPAVRWSDIGGQSHVRNRLRQSVEWPLLHPDAFTR